MHLMLGMNASGKEIAFCDSKYVNVVLTDTKGFCMNPGDGNNNWGGNDGGWGRSYMRTTIMPQFVNLLPSVWRSIVKACTKYTDNGANSMHAVYTSVYSTQDTAFLPSEFEVFGERTYANKYEQNYQTQYDYFRIGTRRQAFNHSSTSSPIKWWLRSPWADSSSGFCHVGPNGNLSYNHAYYSYGIRPCFVVS